jgi:DNA helicase MCM9
MSLCKHLHMFFCSVALTLIGGVQHVDASGTRVRGESHLLLVGDPGMQSIVVTIYTSTAINTTIITS